MPACPTPLKRAYPSLAAGRLAAREHEQEHRDGRMEAYVCACGRVHIGHLSLSTRIREALGR